jgi:2,3-bisphosphoglycerate-dependent phosphoglycerate mutase
MVKKLYIYIFRHGQTPYNRDGKFTGFQNPPLTKLGIRQARIVARKLKNKKFQIAFHSRLKRSKQTLKEVLKYHPECKKLVKDDRIIERNYGNLNGMSHEQFIKDMGNKLYKLEVQGDFITDLSEKDKNKLKQFLGKQEYDLIHRGYNVAPPNGESFQMVEKRVKSFTKDLIKLMKKKKVNVAISAHGNSIRLFRKIMENASIKKADSWFIPYDKVFIYSITA